MSLSLAFPRQATPLADGPAFSRQPIDLPVEVLVIGYGNPLRRDDGAGPAVAARLARRFGDDVPCKCLTAHQLAPEHADDLRRARRVLFIDASINLPAGKIRITPLKRGQGPFSRSITHHLSPQTLLSLSQELFGHAPQAWFIEIGAADLAVGEHLSPRVARAATRLVQHLSHRLRLWSILKDSIQDSSVSFFASKEGPHVCS